MVSRLPEITGHTVQQYTQIARGGQPEFTESFPIPRRGSHLTLATRDRPYRTGVYPRNT
jgi:hypothetical protein